MNKPVKRYGFEFEDFWEMADGEYVLYSDYDSLSKKLEEARRWANIYFNSSGKLQHSLEAKDKLLVDDESGCSSQYGCGCVVSAFNECRSEILKRLGEECPYGLKHHKNCSCKLPPGAEK